MNPAFKTCIAKYMTCLAKILSTPRLKMLLCIASLAERKQQIKKPYETEETKITVQRFFNRV
jgi:hypothetical protein